MSVKDVIKKSVLESTVYNQSMAAGTYVTIVVDMLVALMIGYIIYRIYKRFFAGVVYSRFFAVTLIGMTIGASMYVLAAIGMLIMLTVVIGMSKMKENRGAFVMVVHLNGDTAKTAVLDELKSYIYSIKNSVLRDDMTELTIQIDMNKDDGIAEKIRTINGVTDVTLIQYNGEYHG